jgi:hypothetical protein
VEKIHSQRSVINGRNQIRAFNPDSAVHADAMREEQTFLSEVNGSLPLSGHRSLVFKMKSKTYNGEVRSSEQDFETLQFDAFATPGLLLAQGPRRFNCGIRVQVTLER